MKKLNIAVCGLMFAAATATLVSCQDIVTYNDGYDDGMTSNGAPSIRHLSCRRYGYDCSTHRSSL